MRCATSVGEGGEHEVVRYDSPDPAVRGRASSPSSRSFRFGGSVQHEAPPGGLWSDEQLVREDSAAVIDEERVVVSLVGVRRVVLGVGGAVGDVLFGIDRSDRAHVGLIAGGA